MRVEEPPSVRPDRDGAVRSRLPTVHSPCARRAKKLLASVNATPCDVSPLLSSEAFEDLNRVQHVRLRDMLGVRRKVVAVAFYRNLKDVTLSTYQQRLKEGATLTLADYLFSRPDAHRNAFQHTLAKLEVYDSVVRGQCEPSTPAEESWNGLLSTPVKESTGCS